MTDRDQVERLAAVEELLERAGLGILITEVDSRRLRFANHRACKMLGYERDRLLSLTVRDIHPAGQASRVEAILESQVIGELQTAVAVPMLRSDGFVFPCDIDSAPATFSGVRCQVCILRDASELEALSDEVRTSSRLLETVLDTIPDVIGLQDLEHRVIRYNKAGYDFFGLEPQQVRGKKCYELINRTGECVVCATSQMLRTRKPAQARTYLEELDVWLDARSYPVLDENGELLQVVEHLRDITAEVRAEEKLRANEEQMRHMQKMQAIGTLAGGVAHDFNNLLTPILGLANMIANTGGVPTSAIEAAEIIERAATRAAELTQQLLGFARKGKLREQAVDVHAMIGETLAMVARTVDRRITVMPRFCSGSPQVLGDAGQLRQVLLNLAVNARDAMPDGGELRVSTRHASENGVPGLVIEVADSGTGISAEHQSRIFEPFFTTKEEGKGTGMGLAMVYGIIENHRGQIEVESEEGRGATFRVWLPSTESVEEDLPADVSVVKGRGRVLVIDDEELVRFVAKRMLESIGYEVLSAADGLEGEQVFRDHHATIDVVIIDLVMPQVGGRECFQRLRAIDPDVRALLSSGYGEDAEVRAVLSEGMAGFVKKPFVASDLSRALAAINGTSAPARESSSTD